MYFIIFGEYGIIKRNTRKGRIVDGQTEKTGNDGEGACFL